MYRSLTSAAIAVLMLSGCSAPIDFFGGSGPPGETADARETCPSFRDLDADDDGAVAAGEFAAAGERLFVLWDDTDDGLLSYNEFNDCVGAPAEDLFAFMDLNGDYMIAPAEFLSASAFEAWDRDGDARLSQEELGGVGFAPRHS